MTRQLMRLLYGRALAGFRAQGARMLSLAGARGSGKRRSAGASRGTTRKRYGPRLPRQGREMKIGNVDHPATTEGCMLVHADSSGGRLSRKRRLSSSRRLLTPTFSKM